MTPEERFWTDVDAEGICWQWTGQLAKGGYGLFYAGMVNGKPRSLSAHRYAWEILVQSSIEGLDLDHRCRNRACVNPDHLEPITHLENIRRSLRGPQPRCKRGHEFTPETTRLSESADGSVRRHCRLCAEELKHHYSEKRTLKRLLASAS